MKPAMNRDLIDISEILEKFVDILGNLTEADQIDLAARLKPAAKSIKEIDDGIKLALKNKFDGKEGTRYGKDFKAILKVIPVATFQQKAFKEANPAMAAKYTEDVDQERITFEVR